MGKMKKQVADSDQPAIVHDAFISKNKKRKEKRHLQNLTAKKVETGDFIPVKRHSLKPAPVAGLNQKGKAQLSTSLPINGNKKGKQQNTNRSFAVSSPAGNPPKKVTGILSNPNTPKRNRSKNEHVTFELSANKLKVLDDETPQGKKIVPEKMKKPPQKGPKKQLPVESSDESDSEEDVRTEDFLDMEASEGEETGSEIGDLSSSEDEDDSKHESKYLSSFLHDDESGSDEDDEDADNDDEIDSCDDEEDDDEDSCDVSSDDEDSCDVSSDDEDSCDVSSNDDSPELDAPKVKNQQSKNGPLKPVDSKKSSVLETSTKIQPATPVKKGKLAEQKNATPAKEEKVSEPKSEQKNKKEKAKPEDTKVDAKVEKKNKKASAEETKTSKKEKFDKPSNFIGFIRKLPATIAQKDIKPALSKLVEADNVLSVVLVKGRRTNAQNAFIYMKDSKSLGNLIHKKVDIGGSTFAIYRAKSSNEEELIAKPVAFLPRVPQWITEAELKQAVEKEIGVGKVEEVIEKKVNKIQQTKNILLSFVDTDALKKAIEQGDFQVKDKTVIIREAMEGVQVPVYRAVLAGIPEKTTEAAVKKLMESHVGSRGAVVNVRFSFRKKTFAFVVFNSEEVMQKALALGDSLSLKGEKLEVRPYVPHTPRKRAPPNEQSKARAVEKRKQKSSPKTEEGQEQVSSKKMKTEIVSDASSSASQAVKKEQQTKQKQTAKKEPQTKQKQTAKKEPQTKQLVQKEAQTAKNDSPAAKKNKNKRKKSGIASPSGQVKATKNFKPNPQRKLSKPPSPSPSPVKAGKIAPLKEKIQAKKAKFQGQKMKPMKKGKK